MGLSHFYTVAKSFNPDCLFKNVCTPLKNRDSISLWDGGRIYLLMSIRKIQPPFGVKDGQDC